MDPKQLSELKSHEQSGTLYGLALDPAGDRLFCGGSDAAVYTFPLEAEDAEPRQAFKHHDNYVSCLAVAPGPDDSPRVISGSYDRTIRWTDAASGELLRSVDAHDGWVRDLALFPDGRRVASVGDDMRVKIWDGEGQLLHALEGHAPRTPQGYTTALYAVAVSPDGKVVASGDRIGEVRLWDAETGSLLHTLQSPAFYTYDSVKRTRSIGGIRSVRFSPDSKHLAIGGIGQVTNVDGFVGPLRLEIWDWREEKRVLEAQHKHQAVLNDIAFAPDGQWLAAGGGGDSGGIVVFWKPDDPQPLHTLKFKGHVQRLALDAPRDTLYGAGFGGLRVWGQKVAPEAEPKAETEKGTKDGEPG